MLARCPGITVHLGDGLGRGVTLEELKERHDAVLLTIGAWWAQGPARWTNAGDERVVDGVEFLRRVNGGERPEMPARVIVVGAGDVAMDACRVAKRLPGCEDVQVLYRRGPDEIPARKDELWGAIEEGIEFVYNVQPVGVHGRRTAASRCAACGRSSASRARTGAAWPIDVPGSEHDYDVRARHPRDRPEGGVGAPRRARADGRREGATRTGTRCARRTRRSSPPATAPSGPRRS